MFGVAAFVTEMLEEVFYERLHRSSARFWSPFALLL